MRLVINAGHTKKGTGTGATGLLNESAETRKIVGELIKQLASTGNETIPAIYDVSSNNLNEAVTLSNNKGADLFVSIHLNAGGGQGCEVYTWQGAQNKRALAVNKNLASLGFKNRGVKDGSKLYVIKNTKAEAMLIEVCFVDNTNDYNLYKQLGYEKIAKAILNGIMAS